MQDPEAYLERLHPDLACPVHRDRDALIDTTHRAFVNHETFFFSSVRALEEFKRRPLRYIDLLDDPVDETRFDPGASSPTMDLDGRAYYFSSQATLAAFRADPARYAKPNREM